MHDRPVHYLVDGSITLQHAPHFALIFLRFALIKYRVQVEVDSSFVALCELATSSAQTRLIIHFFHYTSIGVTIFLWIDAAKKSKNWKDLRIHDCKSRLIFPERKNLSYLGDWMLLRNSIHLWSYSQDNPINSNTIGCLKTVFMKMISRSIERSWWRLCIDSCCEVGKDSQCWQKPYGQPCILLRLGKKFNVS